MIPFDLGRNNLADALLCARCCELSYADFNSNAFVDGISALGFLRHAVIDTAGVKAFVAANEHTLVVCFPGTTTVAHWLADAMAAKVPMHGMVGTVHTGFLLTLQAVCSDVFAVVNNFLAEATCMRILVCGHSLGGAVATLFASRCKHFIHLVATFGSPRVGDADFADRFNQRFKTHSMRFVHNNDVAARVPPKWMGYEHVWHQHYFDAKGKLHDYYHPTRLRKLWHAIQGRAWALLEAKFFDGAQDHSIRDYVRLIEAEARRRDA